MKQIKRKKLSFAQAATYVALSLWSVTTVYPFLWVIINSFRQKGRIRTDSFSIPWPWTDSFTLDNYAKANSRFEFGQAYTNSLIISISVTVIVVLLAGLAAYGLVRYNFRGKRIVQGLSAWRWCWASPAPATAFCPYWQPSCPRLPATFPLPSWC